MVYIYTRDGCCECGKLTQRFRSNFVRYTERDISRLTSEYPKDGIDAQALEIAAASSFRMPLMVEGDVMDVDECVS